MNTATKTTPASAQNRPGRLLTYFPAGFAWPATDDRFGRYVICHALDPSAPFTLGVVDDFGELVEVPSLSIMGGGTVHAVTGVRA